MSKSETVHDVTDLPKKPRFDWKKIATYSGLFLAGAAAVVVLTPSKKHSASLEVSAETDPES